MTPSRRQALQSLGCLTLTALAGCNVLGSGEPAGDAPDGSNATSTAAGTHDGHTHTHDGNSSTQDHSTPTEEDALDFANNPEEVHPRLVEETSVGDDEVLIGFRLEDSSLPFTTEVYEAPAEAAVHATANYETHDFDDIPLVPDDPTALQTVDTEAEDVHYGTTTIGEPLKVTLVARHDDSFLEFSSWRRTGYPHDGHQDALVVDCYCGGEIYYVPTEGAWARVIQVTPTDTVEPGTTIVLNWTSSTV